MTEARASGRTPLRVLFSMRNFWYVKLFDGVVRELAERGHHVHILAERGEHSAPAQEWNEAAASLARRHDTVTVDWSPRQIDDTWIDLRVLIRRGIDYLRFLEKDYADAPMLAARARRRAPGWLVRLVEHTPFRWRPGRRLVSAVLGIAERALPPDPEVAGYVEAYPADVILVTPLLTLGSEQVDVLRVARRRGVPTALCVGSWDHLSSKALIRECPDRVFVWNDTQKREAMTLHGVPADRVVVTGAQCFDQWFNRRPTLERAAFCAKVGLDPDRPFVLYVCSALFEGSPSEAAFARQWILALRASGDPRLERAGVLVRPHPKRAFEWDDVDLADLPNVSLWPGRAAAPFDAGTRADYFDSLYHASVTMGLNTSALIEAGIAGRAVHTILLPEFHDNQEGTLHFRYLLDGGLLRVTRDLPSHLAQLSASLRDADETVHHNRAFIEQFVRPRGLDVAATPIFADAVEELAATRPSPVPEAFWSPFVRRLLEPAKRRAEGMYDEKAGRARWRKEKALAREEQAAALEALRQRQKAEQREARRQAREARQAQAERARADKQLAKQRQRAERQRRAPRPAKPKTTPTLRDHVGRLFRRLSAGGQQPGRPRP